MPVPGDTELPSRTIGSEGTFKEQEGENYIRRSIEIAKERFFDRGQSATIALKNPKKVPGYISLVAIQNPEKDMEVVISHYNGLSAHGGVVTEDIGGQEIQISYRRLRGNRAIPQALRRRTMGFEYGVIVLPYGTRPTHWINTVYSLKSTMTPYDATSWEEGDTAPNAYTGVYPGQTRLQPTKADYQAILDTVTRGTKVENLTNKSAKRLIQINRGHQFEELSLPDAQKAIERRYQEIIRAERLAKESSEGRLPEPTRVSESDRSSEQSFDNAIERLRQLAIKIGGQDAFVVDGVADQLEKMDASLNMVRTLLESDNPIVKEALRNETRHKREVKLTSFDMYVLTAYIATNPKFQSMREKSGFSESVIYGTSLDHREVPHLDTKTRTEVSQDAKIKILEALEFLHPGETIARRMERIAGLPSYQQAETGEGTGVIHTFRYDSSNGESIIYDPYSTTNKYSNIRITSPLFGPYLVAMVDLELRINHNGVHDRLEPTTGEIKSIVLRFEGNPDTYPEEIGKAMLRLSKKVRDIPKPL